jgi:hypothetical protein
LLDLVGPNHGGGQVAVDTLTDVLSLVGRRLLQDVVVVAAVDADLVRWGDPGGEVG